MDSQRQLIEIMKRMIPANINLADEISDVLDVSADSAYRRLRCETELTINEALKLCEHFDIPLESLNPALPSVVSFKINPLTEKADSFTGYLLGVEKELSYIARCENRNIMYGAEDLPFFYHFFYKNLSHFKISYWTKSILNTTEFQGKKIEQIEILPEWRTIAEHICHLFLEIPTVEVWHSDTIKSTVQQIKFYWEAGFFQHKQAALDVIEEFDSMLKTIQMQAEAGKKYDNQKQQFTNTDYTLYVSDLMIGNNCVILQGDEKISNYIGYNSFNYMRTTNRFFIDQARSWLNNLIAKSTLISTVSEKQRNQFFKQIFTEVQSLKNLVEAD